MNNTQVLRRMDHYGPRFIIYLVTLFLTSTICKGRISDLRLCGDSECKAPVALGRTLIRYYSGDPHVLSFNGNVNVKIYSKSAGTNGDLWGGEINGRRGYFPKEFIREYKVLVKELKFTVPTEAGPTDGGVTSTETTKEDQINMTTGAASILNREQVQETKTTPNTETVQESTTIQNTENVQESTTIGNTENVQESTTIGNTENVQKIRPIQNIEQGQETSTVLNSDEIRKTTTILNNEKIQGTTTILNSEMVKETTTIPTSEQVQETTTIPNSEQVQETTIIHNSEEVNDTTTVLNSEQVQEPTTIPNSEQVQETTIIHNNEEVNDTTTVLNSEQVQEPTTIPNSEQVLETTIIHNNEVNETTTVLNSEQVQEPTTILNNEEVLETTIIYNNEVVNETTAVPNSEQIQEAITILNNEEVLETTIIHNNEEVNETTAIPNSEQIKEAITILNNEEVQETTANSEQIKEAITILNNEEVQETTANSEEVQEPTTPVTTLEDPTYDSSFTDKSSVSNDPAQTTSYQLFFQSALKGIHSVASFTNEFPLSLGKLSSNIIRNFVTNAEVVPDETRAQFKNKDKTDFHKKGELNFDSEINPTRPETDSSITPAPKFEAKVKESVLPTAVSSSIESMESESIHGTVTPSLDVKTHDMSTDKTTGRKIDGDEATQTTKIIDKSESSVENKPNRNPNDFTEIGTSMNTSPESVNLKTVVKESEKDTESSTLAVVDNLSNHSDEENDEGMMGSEERLDYEDGDDSSTEEEDDEEDLDENEAISVPESSKFNQSEMNITEDDNTNLNPFLQQDSDEKHNNEESEIIKATEMNLDKNRNIINYEEDSGLIENENIGDKRNQVSKVNPHPQLNKNVVSIFLKLVTIPKKPDTCPAKGFDSSPLKSEKVSFVEIIEEVGQLLANDDSNDEAQDGDSILSLWAWTEVLMDNVSTLVSDNLPESVKESIREQTDRLLSPRIFVLMTLTGLGITFVFWLHVISKVHRKEHKLITLLCRTDKLLFEANTERDVHKDETVVANEKIFELENNLSNMQESFNEMDEEFLQLKVENTANVDCIATLREQIEQLHSSTHYLNSDVEEKAKQHLTLQEEYAKIVTKAEDLSRELTKVEDELQSEQSLRADDTQELERLKNEVIELEQSKAQLLTEAQVWNERVMELQRQNGVFHQTCEELRRELSTKEEEADMLRESLEALKFLDDDDAGENTKFEKLQRLMDVSAIKAELISMTEGKKLLCDELNATLDNYKLMDVELTNARAENARLKERDEELQRERNDAVVKLEILTTYFKQKEVELQRELGVQEAMRQQTEESALSVTEKAALYEQEVALHRSHLEALKKEMDSQARSYKAQIAQHENKAHENWLAARAAERKAEEAKQAAALLRNKLTLAEQEKESMNRIQGDGPIMQAARRYAGSNGEVPSPPRFDLDLPDLGQSGPSSLMREPLDLSGRMPFLPLDRPLPPPPLGMPPPPFFGDQMPPPMFDMQGSFVPPMLPPFDQRGLPMQPPMGSHMGDGRLLPLERHLTPPRDFHPSNMRRPPSGHRYSPPYQFSERHNEMDRFRESSPLPPRFTERPGKHGHSSVPRLSQNQMDRK